MFRMLAVAGFVLAIGAAAGCDEGVTGSGSGTTNGNGNPVTNTGSGANGGTGTTGGTDSGETTGTTGDTDSGETTGTTGDTNSGETTDTTGDTNSGETTDTTGGTPTDPGGNRPVIGNLIASPDNADCVYQPGGAVGGANAIQVYFYILLIGANPDQLPGLVHVTAASDTGLAADYRSAVNNQAQSVAALPIRSGDFGRTHSITLTVDAGDDVSESDEGDNQIRAVVTLPAGATGTTTLQCSVTRA
jgi:hypothetical protein